MRNRIHIHVYEHLRSSPVCPELSPIYTSCSVLYWLYIGWENCKEVQAQGTYVLRNKWGLWWESQNCRGCFYSLTSANCSFSENLLSLKVGLEKRRHPKPDQTKKVTNSLKPVVRGAKPVALPAPHRGSLGHTGYLMLRSLSPAALR